MGCAVHMCSLLHCRYGDFSEQLMDQLQKIYSGKIEGEEDKVFYTICPLTSLYIHSTTVIYPFIYSMTYHFYRLWFLLSIG